MKRRRRNWSSPPSPRAAAPRSSKTRYRRAAPARTASRSTLAPSPTRTIERRSNASVATACARRSRCAASLAEASDGTIHYEMKRQFSDGRRLLRFTPREFLLRLCALVPPPSFHMVRYAGIFSAHASGPPRACTGRGMHDAPRDVLSPPDRAAGLSGSASSNRRALRRQAALGRRRRAFREYKAVDSLPPRAPTMHDAAAEGPEDAGRARRLEWAKLLKRVFAIDVLRCARCEGPMRLIAFVDDERIARKILEHLGLPARAPPRGRALPRRGQLPLVDEHTWDGVDPPHAVD